MAAVEVKLVLLGHKNVGKTAIFNRYVYDEFVRTSMVRSRSEREGSRPQTVGDSYSKRAHLPLPHFPPSSPLLSAALVRPSAPTSV